VHPIRAGQNGRNRIACRAGDAAVVSPGAGRSGGRHLQYGTVRQPGRQAGDRSWRPARHITPGTQVTMDFVATRLNIDISADGIIIGLRCG
jgi:hypothetical protein